LSWNSGTFGFFFGNPALMLTVPFWIQASARASKSMGSQGPANFNFQFPRARSEGCFGEVTLGELVVGIVCYGLLVQYAMKSN